MPDEIRIPVNAKIPESLHNSLLEAVQAGKYKDKTACITEALEKLLCNMQEETQDNTGVLQEKENEIQNLQSEIQSKYAVIRSNENEIQNYKSVLQNKESEIHRLQSVIREAPDPLELARLQARYEELQAHNDTLKVELEKAGQREEDLKKVHNNYMLQVQTLINQKAIEAPGEKKKPFWKFW
jgi:Arc/MetJ-type ribon-helix-helix transcriptional regulator